MGNWLACVSGGFLRSVRGLNRRTRWLAAGRRPLATREPIPGVEAAEVDITDEASVPKLFPQALGPGETPQWPWHGVDEWRAPANGCGRIVRRRCR
jgi:hypothetical protein